MFAPCLVEDTPGAAIGAGMTVKQLAVTFGPSESHLKEFEGEQTG